jgi:hypothetical protein
MTAAKSRCIATLVLGGLWLASCATANAQLPQPRCDGYPPVGRGGKMTSVLIGYAGKPCYGQVFDKIQRGQGTRGARGATFGAMTAINTIRVVQPPARGSFKMIGLREFQYIPSASLKGWDRIVVQYDVDRGGATHSGRLIFQATSREAYDAGAKSSQPAP